MRSLFLAVLLLIGFAAYPVTGKAQPAHVDSGSVQLSDWPPFLQESDASVPDSLDLLPSIDRLTLDYRYEARSEAPQMTFALVWAPGAFAAYEGRRVRYEALPAEPRMAGIELRADVVVDGRKVAEAIVAVDSMALGPAPDTLRFEGASLTYGTVFADTPADEARRYFEEGFRLANLEVLRVTFEEEASRDPEIVRRRPPSRRTVYVPDPFVDVLIGWRIGPNPYRVRPPARGGTPRGEQVGREADRSGQRTRPAEGEAPEEQRGRTSQAEEDEKKAERQERATKRGDRKEKDDDDDEESLVEEALIAAAIVGAVAYGGGTVGYFGTEETPLGLTAGRVYPGGGGLLQAGVNPEMLSDDGPDRLTVKALGFYDLFEAPVQPALGVGAVLTGRERTEIAPSFSVGAAGNFGRVIVLGGYDLVQGGIEFGVAFNFRHRSEDPEPQVADRR